MSEYSVEEVLAAINGFVGYSHTHHGVGSELIGIAQAYAERIKADEGVVPLAWLEAEPSASLESLQSEVGMLVHSMQFHVGKNKPANRPAANKLFPLFTHPPAQAAQVDQCGWLIENGKNVPDLRYRCMRQGRIEWTADHNEALRFARRVDAEQFAEEDEDAWCIVEHTSLAPTTEPVAQGEAAAGLMSSEGDYTVIDCPACGCCVKYSKKDASSKAAYRDLCAEVSALRAENDSLRTLAAQPRAVPDVRAMADRLMGWRLPDDFRPDCGISFDPESLKNWPGIWPVGTNLFTADQAEQMFRYVLDAAPSATPAQPAERVADCWPS